VYFPRPLLVLLVISYFLYLLAIDWMNGPTLAWYRPFLLAFLIIAVAGWCYRKQDSDEP
jgi:hypothetical protein